VFHQLYLNTPLCIQLPHHRPLLRGLVEKSNGQLLVKRLNGWKLCGKAAWVWQCLAKSKQKSVNFGEKDAEKISSLVWGLDLK
jgi:hypothetical protein